MALSGTLSDLGIVDLIQFPGTGKKTGELIIAGTEDEARLYYHQGLLKHIICGEYFGMEALVNLVAWEEGEFEFRMGTTTDEETIKIDLHRALMSALQTRDERREDARKKAIEQERLAEQKMSERTTIVPEMNTQSPASLDNSRMQEILSQVAATFPYIEFASVYNRNGKKACMWSRDDNEISTYTEMIISISDVFNSHPRKELQKVYLTDNLGKCIGSAIGDTFLLFLAASEESSLGVVSIAASKIATAIVGDEG